MNHLIKVWFEFPSPLEVWVVSYRQTGLSRGLYTNVSVPSRGMGGFLPMRNANKLLLTFPSPLEVWVVSYKMSENIRTKHEEVSVPSRGMGGFLT